MSAYFSDVLPRWVLHEILAVVVGSKIKIAVVVRVRVLASIRVRLSGDKVLELLCHGLILTIWMVMSAISGLVRVERPHAIWNEL